MKEIYDLGSSKHIAWHKKFNRHMLFVLIAVTAMAVVAAGILYDLHARNRDLPEPVSKTVVKKATFGEQLFTSPYFQFSDSGNWRLASEESSASKVIFRKYLGSSPIVQHQLIVYINRTPIPLELESPRVLPVSIKDGNSLEPTSVSRPCGQTYAAGELHKVKVKQIERTTMLCDPDLSQYKVMFGQIGGDYNLKLRRSSGILANYIIIYQDQRVSSDPESLLQVAKSFQAL